MHTLCRYILQCIDIRPVGTFNLGTSDGISKADFALSLASILGLQTTTLSIGSLSDLSLPAKRPLDMRMNIELTQSTFSLQPPTMSEEIYRTAASYHG